MPYRHRGEVELELADRLEPKCALVKYTPGSSPEILNYYIDKGYRGIVLEGTGLGHVASDWIDGIKKGHRGEYPCGDNLAMPAGQDMRPGIRYWTLHAGCRSN